MSRTEEGRPSDVQITRWLKQKKAGYFVEEEKALVKTVSGLNFSRPGLSLKCTSIMSHDSVPSSLCDLLQLRYPPVQGVFWFLFSAKSLGKLYQ
jgi:hypothetical protein